MKKLTKYTKIAAITMLSGVTALSFGGLANASTVVPTGTTTVEICRSINNAFASTSATFNYTFTAGTGLDSTTMPSGQIAFSAQSSTGGTISKCTNVDVGGVTFTNTTPKQVNVTVTESVASGSVPVDSTSYTLTFDLRNTVDSSSQITGQVASLAYIKNASGTKVSQMDFSSDLTPTLQYIKLTNKVGGTAGNPNQEFGYSVTVSGPTGSTYEVWVPGNSSKTCDYNQGCTVRLKGDETAYIGYIHGQGGGNPTIPVGSIYSIVQQAYGVSEYTTQHQIESGSWVSSRDTSQQTVVSSADGYIDVTFKNTKDADVPTGIFLNVWPYALLGAASITIIVCAKKNFATKKH